MTKTKTDTLARAKSIRKHEALNEKWSRRNPAAEGALAAKLDDRFNVAIKRIEMWNFAMCSTPSWDADRYNFVDRLEQIADDLEADGTCLRCSQVNKKSEIVVLSHGDLTLSGKVVDGVTKIVTTIIRCACSGIVRRGAARVR